MFRIAVVFLAVAVAAYAAEIPTEEKQVTFNPHVKTDAVETHPVLKKEARVEFEKHPVYRGEEQKNEGRARMRPVKPTGQVVKQHDMLADQPAESSTEVNRIDNLAIPNYGYAAEVAYPDVPYAPGYNYDTAYSATNNYDMYGNSVDNYMIEPDTSTFGLIWSQVPDSRTIVNYVGRTIAWIFSSIFVLLIGSFLTIGVCSYTNLCSITFNGVGPIHEEMRSLITPERLEKIGNAADFVKNAIDKYQKIQKVSAVEGTRRRRAVFH